MRLPDRLKTALQSLSRAERHRRKVERELWSPLPPVPAAEVAEFDRLAEGIEAWKTGEFPAIETVMAPEPIGPQPPTVDDLYAAFEANPLEAQLPGTPAKDNRFYADLLEQQPLSEQTRTDLENVTGYWTAGQLKELIERGAQK
jgi:hypothetical protein